MGSVKDLKIIEPAYENQPGKARFTFSDRYSVFDWGEMPDHIVNKGRALAVMAAFNFEKLGEMGIRTHYRGLIDSHDMHVSFLNLKEGDNGSDIMKISTAVVYRPTPRMISTEAQARYDYSLFEKNRGTLNNYLLPLEIIFRNGLPEGSSVFKRIKAAKDLEEPEARKLKLQEIYEELGLKAEPKPGDMLPKPVMNYTTKLESGDRSLNNFEAFEISGLNHDNFSRVASVALRVNDMISKQAEKTGFVHYDGKVEMLWRNDYPVVCDVVGTFDEDRFGFEDEQVSKEFLRQWYKKKQPDFPIACDNWKKKGEGWQRKCGIKPIKLDPKLAELVSQMYMAGCNQYVEKEIFDAPKLEKVMEKLRPFR